MVPLAVHFWVSLEVPPVGEVISPEAGGNICEPPTSPYYKTFLPVSFIPLQAIQPRLSCPYFFSYVENIQQPLSKFNNFVKLWQLVWQYMACFLQSILYSALSWSSLIPLILLLLVMQTQFDKTNNCATLPTLRFLAIFNIGWSQWCVKAIKLNNFVTWLGVSPQ